MNYYFSFNQRLLSQIFTKFRDTFVAFCELVNNSIQAKATEIRIYIDENPPDKVTKTKFNQIKIRDNGVGVSKNDFRRKLLEVATDVKEQGQGIGRFAALQIGATVHIETVAYDQVEQAFYESSFELNAHDLEKSKYLDKIKLPVDHVKLDGERDSYYQVRITDFYDDSITQNESHKKASKHLLMENIGNALFSRYPIEIYNESIRFFINDQPIQPKDFIIGEPEFEKSQFIDLDGVKHNLDFGFVKVKSTGVNQRIFIRVSNNNLKSIGHSFNYKADIPEQNVWFVYVDSPFFDNRTDVFRNFDISGMDEELTHIISEIQSSVDQFFAKKYQKYKSFIERLKTDRYYPYKSLAPSSTSKEIVFNQIAYHVEREHKILQEENKLRELIYALVDKALNQGDIQVILSQIVKLDQATIVRFAELLDKVDLDDIVKFSEEVAAKNIFLDFLHAILYGQPAKHLKERSQLHKIVEGKLWIFGEQYNNTPRLFSDKKLKHALNQLREEFLVYEPSSKDENLIELQDEGLRNITDLFFYNEKILDDESREVMIVELKAPKVRIHRKELNQVDTYAFEIEKRGVFPENLAYKICLIGSDISDFARTKLGQIDPNSQFLYSRPKKGIEVYVVKWSDLLQQQRKSYHIWEIF